MLKNNKKSKKGIVILSSLLALSTIGNGISVSSLYLKKDNEKNNSEISKEFSEKEKEITQKLLDKEKELEEKEKEFEKKENEYNLDIKELEKDKKEFLEQKAKENNYSKVLNEQSKAYQELIGKLLNTEKSSLYKNVSEVSKSLERLGNDIDLLKDSAWTKETLVRLGSLESSLETINKFDSEKVTSKHKASYEELLKATSLYEKAIKEIKEGIDKKEISKVVEGSTTISEGAKRFQIAINIYNSEIS